MAPINPDLGQTVQILDGFEPVFLQINLKTRRHAFVEVVHPTPTDMTTIDDFKSASFEAKCDVVTTQSNYIATRNMGNCKVYLYHSGKFFIEVFYSPIYKKVLMINAFNDTAGLLPYVNKISLASLGVEIQD